MCFHKLNDKKQLSRVFIEPEKKTPWLPLAKLEAMTSGTDPASNLEWKQDNNFRISWKPARVYGSNQLVNQIVCYNEIGNKMAVQIPVPGNTKAYKLTNLKLGEKYKIWIEAVVLSKLNRDSESGPDLISSKETRRTLDSQIEKTDYYKDLNDYRCVNILSASIMVRVPAPCEPVVLYLTGYGTDRINLGWSKPNLYSSQKDPDNPQLKLHLNRILLGYRLEINGVTQKTLESDKLTCTLTKCKQNKTYNIVMITRTCLSNLDPVRFF